MGVIRVATKDGGITEIEMEITVAFEEDFHGSVLFLSSPGYDDARRIWNGMIDRHPAIIARCAGTADVVSAVNFAREHDLLVAVKGGGHNVAGNAVCEGGLMIDLSGMRSVHVDNSFRSARVEGGDPQISVRRLVKIGQRVRRQAVVDRPAVEHKLSEVLLRRQSCPHPGAGVGVGSRKSR